nr:MAG TPA: hypothetical protein [Bacteriophage sp.]
MGKREGAILLFFCLWYNTYGWNSFWSFYLHLYDIVRNHCKVVFYFVV